MNWKDFYRSIELTDEEKEEALFEGRVKKYRRQLHAEYWQEAESKKPTPKPKKK
jgi:hypothetical protein